MNISTTEWIHVTPELMLLLDGDEQEYWLACIESGLETGYISYQKNTHGFMLDRGEYWLDAKKVTHIMRINKPELPTI